MTAWTKLLRHPETIERLYERPPSLSQFGLSEVSWESADNMCMLRGTLSQFPDFPRSAWEDDANRIGIRLQLMEVDEFDMEGWSFENIVDIEITQIDGGSKFLVVAHGESLDFRATCTALHIADIFAYRSLRAEPVN